MRTWSGIIPARAGFTPPWPADPSSSTDHPRSRGVYVNPDRPITAKNGIIPARAGFTRDAPAPPGSGQDHPRSRGVYTEEEERALTAVGSSPLARGLHALRIIGVDVRGIIPARAGFTWRRRGSPSPRTDHPRSRGVYPALLITGLMNVGIIPARAGFTRGRLACRGPTGDHPRSRGVYLEEAGLPIAPDGSSPLARGLRTTCSTRSSSSPDHPRSRGVYSHEDPDHRAGRGSSPLARGLPGRGPARPGGVGIIPARAGFTTPPAPLRAPTRDHPRSRGVYPLDRGVASRMQGSSPLARGLHVYGVATRFQDRIIPARAGFTMTIGRSRRNCWDHPRSRGVYRLSPVISRRRPGSSPLARGLLGIIDCGGQWARIIPARAGFTRSPTGASCAARDHPRSRGVYGSLPQPGRYGPGSSPLARGLRPLESGHGGGAGIIPARAGFTGRRGSRSCCTRDHPRSRGVYATATRAPPRRLRIIPARAGFTANYPARRYAQEDHPRSRGVYPRGSSSNTS